uniref:Cytidylate kinase-like family protein n=1 Tax=Eiseniibacteriota bacterium TaxID=2212470 RepID=A0A832MIM3_UNCEI
MPTMQQILERQLQRWELEKRIRTSAAVEEPAPTRAAAGPHAPVAPLVTVSRQKGAGGSSLAASLAACFRYTLLDRDLLDRICGSTDTRRRLLASLDEHVKPVVTTWVEALLGNEWVDAGDYMRALVETVGSIAALGGAVIVGRGANFIVGPARGFHVRVVAPREVRVARIAARDHVAEKEALRRVETADRDRHEFIRRQFHREIDDAVAYDLVINTGYVDLDTATDLVVKAALEKFERLRPAQTAAAAAR